MTCSFEVILVDMFASIVFVILTCVCDSISVAGAGAGESGPRQYFAVRGQLSGERRDAHRYAGE